MSLFGDGGIAGFFTPERTTMLIRTLVVFVLGAIFTRVVSLWVARILEREGRPQQALIAKRVVSYILFGLVVVGTLHELGFHLGVLFGAAGILTVALGFASQTSASNLISGLFLIAERSFTVGDIVQIGDHTGEILSIDLLSVKLRTYENTLVRVPNEEIIKSRIKNLTAFPIRRSDIVVHVSYESNLQHVRRVFEEAMARVPHCLADPGPEFFVKRFADSSVELQLCAWTRREGFAEFQNVMRMATLEALQDAGVEIPFPRFVVEGASGLPPER